MQLIIREPFLACRWHNQLDPCVKKEPFTADEVRTDFEADSFLPASLFKFCWGICACCLFIEDALGHVWTPQEVVIVAKQLEYGNSWATIARCT